MGAIAVLISLLSTGGGELSDRPLETWVAECESQGMTWSGWCLPTVVIESRLEGVITLTECTAISGLSCRITVVAPERMPVRLLFTPVDRDGNSVGPERQLVYPDLVPNGWSSGIATFFQMDGNPTSVRVRGIWQSD